MRFLLIAQEANGRVRLLDETAFDTRSEAIAALAGFMSHTDLGEAESYLVDLDAAQPVIMLPQPPAVLEEALAEEEIAAAELVGTLDDPDVLAEPPLEVHAPMGAVLDAEERGTEVGDQDADAAVWEAPALEPESFEPEPLEAIEAVEDELAYEPTDDDAPPAPPVAEGPASEIALDQAIADAIVAEAAENPSVEDATPETPVAEADAAIDDELSDSDTSADDASWPWGAHSSNAEGPEARDASQMPAVDDAAGEPTDESDEAATPIVASDDVIEPEVEAILDALEEPEVDATPMVPPVAPVDLDVEAIASSPSDAPDERALDEAAALDDSPSATDAESDLASIPSGQLQARSEFDALQQADLSEADDHDADDEPARAGAESSDFIAFDAEQTEEGDAAPEAPEVPHVEMGDDERPSSEPTLRVVAAAVPAPASQADGVTIPSPSPIDVAPAPPSAPAASTSMGAAPAAPSADAAGVAETLVAGDSSVAAEAGSYGSDLDELACDDCVYVDTCPNKDELQPTSCGSFQWKSL